jgi:hypothetical protein
MSGRVPAWETALAAYLATAVPEVRGGRASVCGLFAGGAVEAVTGHNPATQFVGRLAEVWDELEATVDGLFPEVAPAMAMTGDLAFFDGSLGVVVGGEALFVGDLDLVRVPRARWSKAWAVGHG